MFTGLIETTGTVLAVEQREGSRRIAVALQIGHGVVLRTGDSIAVSGVCLTAVDIEADATPPRFHADLAAETVARTSLSLLAPGSTVNLELPTPAGTPLGGHVVQGHVDGTGTLLSLEPVDAKADPALADWWLRVAVTPQGDVVSVAIIPHTYARTNLHALKAGQPVNIEADVMIKFMEQRSSKGQQGEQFDLTVEYLIANGY
jgi:riboflavin synthase